MEKQIFSKITLLIKDKDEINLDCCFIYEKDYEENDWKGYRVNSLQYGTFEIAEVRGREEYNIETDDFEYIDEIWYFFKGDFDDELPEITPKIALNLILPKV